MPGTPENRFQFNFEKKEDSKELIIILDEPVIDARKFSYLERWFLDDVLNEERLVIINLERVKETNPAALAGFLKLMNKRLAIGKKLTFINAKDKVLEMMQFTSTASLLLEDY